MINTIRIQIIPVFKLISIIGVRRTHSGINIRDIINAQ